MNRMIEEALTGPKTRYTKLWVFDKLATFGIPVPDSLKAPFSFRWDEARNEGQVLFRETLLARIRPWHQDHYNDEPRQILQTRAGLPTEALTRIHEMITQACDFTGAVHEDVKTRIADMKVADRAQKLKSADSPSLFTRIISTGPESETITSMSMPVGGTARALAGLEGLDPTAKIVLERGHKGNWFRILVKGEMIADLSVHIENLTLEEEVAHIQIREKGGRRLDPDALRIEMNAGLAHWNRLFSESGLVRAMDQVFSLSSIDPLSVMDRTCTRNSKITHIEHLGDMSITGVSLGRMLSLKYKGLFLGSFIMTDSSQDLTGKFLPLTPDVMGNLGGLMTRDLMTDLEARWRCGAYDLNPEDFPGLPDLRDMEL